MAFPGGTPSHAVAEGVDGVTVAVPLQASGVAVQTQSSNGSALAGQTTGVPVSFQVVGNPPYPVVGATLPGGGIPSQYTEQSPKLGQYISLEEQSWTVSSFNQFHNSEQCNHNHAGDKSYWKIQFIETFYFFADP